MSMFPTDVSSLFFDASITQWEQAGATVGTTDSSALKWLIAKVLDRLVRGKLLYGV